MRARIAYPDAKSFQSMLETLSKIVDEAVMTVSQEGVRIRALDPAHVAMIEIMLPPDTFLEYEVEEEAKIGFNVVNIAKIVKRGKKGDKVEIEATDDRVTWTIAGAAIKRYKLLNLDIAEPEIPEAQFEFKARIALIVDAFKNALRDAETVGDTVELEADEEKLLIRGRGTAVAETEITRDKPAVIDFQVDEPSKAAYSIDYLKHVLALTKVADTVSIEFSTDSPLRLQFSLPAGGRVNYLLAPKAA
ncbi:proliferating cell nuclear antigen PcnA [Pyrolobus fumarii 1A]|uniref:DNA polymerase sliding clamp n=1 Tax=Pyrolobus fumarii (strain DSM 11204 / 1A) TaxID=694429 RepID=G0ECI2_PYRF1|nr:proliferating cell nuclear antigen (pcna) [Pyrolobus fumarii]AEM39552.1 proliferating cell nuclear antigen PcnA [Pyrolobus fumarii 1A]